MNEEQWFARQREEMVREQIEKRGISAPNVLAAMGSTPRHLFVPFARRHEAYHDRALPIGPDQTISQPYIVALMLEELRLHEGARVLEIGTGSGYQAALLSQLAKEVYTIELDAALQRRTKQILDELGCSNILFKAGNGYDGWREEAPFDAIVVSAAPEDIPRELVRELKIGGRMVLPLGEGVQELVLLEKTAEGLESTELGAVQFVEMKR